MTITIEDMASFCKRKGFVFPNSEIYGGQSGFFDYGPMGVEVKNELKNSYWRRFVNSREDVVGIDGTVISHPKVWVASGHVENFGDLMLTTVKSKQKFRADTFIEDALGIAADGMKADEINKLVKEKGLKAPNGEEFEEVKDFNLMFTTNVGPVVDEKSIAYLRPETAQMIFADFKSVFDTSRVKLPFGIAQIGRAFRNEISPRDFLFRSREFEQMEIEFFIHPDDEKCSLLNDKDKEFEFQLLSEDNQKEGNEHVKIKLGEMLDKKMLGEWHAYWLKEFVSWFVDLGIDPSNLRLREHMSDELAHYSSACFDIEYKFPFGWKEIHGCANRGQFDLQQHEKVSKKSMSIFDEGSQSKVVPRVIEPSQGLDRAFLSFMFEAYEDDKERGNIVMKLSPLLAPVKLGVFPLVKNKEEIVAKAKEVYDMFKMDISCVYDESGSVGKRYARSDEVGIPFCLTIDFESLEDESVTIRDRDSTKQRRVKIAELQDVVGKLMKGADFSSFGVEV